MTSVLLCRLYDVDSSIASDAANWRRYRVLIITYQLSATCQPADERVGVASTRVGVASIRAGVASTSECLHIV